jgi:hypothetical protein
MTCPLMLAVVPYGIPDADPPEDQIQRFPGRFNQEVKVIGHQAERMEPEPRYFLAFLQDRHEMKPVSVILEDGLPVNSAHHHMIDIRQAGFSCCSRHINHQIPRYSKK